jgi:hypothetical protein
MVESPMTEIYNRNVALFGELIKNDKFYDENKGKFVFIVDGVLKETGSWEEIMSTYQTKYKHKVIPGSTFLDKVERKNNLESISGEEDIDLPGVEVEETD